MLAGAFLENSEKLLTGRRAQDGNIRHRAITLRKGCPEQGNLKLTPTGLPEGQVILKSTRALSFRADPISANRPHHYPEGGSGKKVVFNDDKEGVLASRGLAPTWSSHE